MKVVVIGLGIQGKKRLAVAGSDAAATVDPFVPQADHKTIEEVPLDRYDAALVCTSADYPGAVRKLEILDTPPAYSPSSASPRRFFSSLRSRRPRRSS